MFKNRKMISQRKLVHHPLRHNSFYEKLAKKYLSTVDAHLGRLTLFYKKDSHEGDIVPTTWQETIIHQHFYFIDHRYFQKWMNKHSLHFAESFSKKRIVNRNVVERSFKVERVPFSQIVNNVWKQPQLINDKVDPTYSQQTHHERNEMSKGAPSFSSLLQNVVSTKFVESIFNDIRHIDRYTFHSLKGITNVPSQNMKLSNIRERMNAIYYFLFNRYHPLHSMETFPYRQFLFSPSTQLPRGVKERRQIAPIHQPHNVMNEGNFLYEYNILQHARYQFDQQQEHNFLNVQQLIKNVYNVVQQSLSTLYRNSSLATIHKIPLLAHIDKFHVAQSSENVLIRRFHQFQQLFNQLFVQRNKHDTHLSLEKKTALFMNENVPILQRNYVITQKDIQLSKVSDIHFQQRAYEFVTKISHLTKINELLSYDTEVVKRTIEKTFLPFKNVRFIQNNLKIFDTHLPPIIHVERVNRLNRLRFSTKNVLPLNQNTLVQNELYSKTTQVNKNVPLHYYESHAHTIINLAKSKLTDVRKRLANVMSKNRVEHNFIYQLLKRYSSHSFMTKKSPTSNLLQNELNVMINEYISKLVNRTLQIQAKNVKTEHLMSLQREKRAVSSINMFVQLEKILKMVTMFHSSDLIENNTMGMRSNIPIVLNKNDYLYDRDEQKIVFIKAIGQHFAAFTRKFTRTSEIVKFVQNLRHIRTVDRNNQHLIKVQAIRTHTKDRLERIRELTKRLLISVGRTLNEETSILSIQNQVIKQLDENLIDVKRIEQVLHKNVQTQQTIRMLNEVHKQVTLLKTLQKQTKKRTDETIRSDHLIHVPIVVPKMIQTMQNIRLLNEVYKQVTLLKTLQKRTKKRTDETIRFDHLIQVPIVVPKAIQTTQNIRQHDTSHKDVTRQQTLTQTKRYKQLIHLIQELKNVRSITRKIRKNVEIVQQKRTMMRMNEQVVGKQIRLRSNANVQLNHPLTTAKRVSEGTPIVQNINRVMREVPIVKQMKEQISLAQSIAKEITARKHAYVEHLQWFASIMKALQGKETQQFHSSQLTNRLSNVIQFVKNHENVMLNKRIIERTNEQVGKVRSIVEQMKKHSQANIRHYHLLAPFIHFQDKRINQRNLLMNDKDHYFKKIINRNEHMERTTEVIRKFTNLSVVNIKSLHSVLTTAKKMTFVMDQERKRIEQKILRTENTPFIFDHQSLYTTLEHRKPQEKQREFPVTPVSFDHYQRTSRESKPVIQAKRVSKQLVSTIKEKHKFEETNPLSYIEKNFSQIVDKIYRAIERKVDLERKRRGL